MNSVYNKKVAFTTKGLKVNKRRNILVLTNNIEKGWMNYEEKIIAIAVVMVLAVGISIPLISNATQVTDKNEKWGQSLKKTYDEKKVADAQKYKTSLVGNYSANKVEGDEVSQVGKDILITDSELNQMSDFYVLQGKSRQEADKTAKEYAQEYNALYVEAVKNGFDATDEEVKTYVDNLKEELNKPENKEQLNSMIKGFGSEDEYWDYEYMVYQKQLPIQKYVKSLENDYNNAHQDEFTEEQLAQNWNTKLDSIKKKLVKEQQFKDVQKPVDIGQNFQE